MEVLRGSLDIEAFWAEVSRRRRLLLLLDYDGTLAPFRAERDEAVPYPGVLERLADLATIPGCAPSIVTGRSIDDIEPLLDLNHVPEIWGSHGFERRFTDGRRWSFPVPPGALDGLTKARLFAEERVPGPALEVKPFGLAFHVRGIEEWRRSSLLDEMRPPWQDIAAGAGLDLRAFDGGLELRIPGRTKGDVVREVRAENSDGPPLLYLGDDLTDEDAFLVLERGEVGVLVRDSLRTTSASIWIRPPDELLHLLDQCRSILRRD